MDGVAEEPAEAGRAASAGREAAPPPQRSPRTPDPRRPGPLYALLRGYFRAALAVFYRRVEVEGRERVPDEGPLLLVANHPNALVDALVVAGALRRPVSLTAKSTLADLPLLGPLMRAAHVIPLHRARDAADGADPSRNVEALSEIERRLAGGAALLIFPEGQSHGDPAMRRFKHGAAHLALAAVDGGHAPGLVVVPAGLVFEDKARFRSRALLRFGEPLAVGAWRAAHPEARTRALTDLVRERLEAVTLNFEGRAEEHLLRRAAEVLETRAEMPPTVGRSGPSLGERARLLARLQRGWRELVGDEAVAALAARATAYRLRLHRLGVLPHEVWLSRSPWRVLRFVLREGALVVVALPLVAWGALNHALPYALARLAARRLSETPDQVASFAVFGSLVLVPAAYLVQVGLALALLPLGWALAYALSLPPSGWAAVALGTRLARARRRAASFLRLGRDRAAWDELAAEGRAIVDAVRALAVRVEGTEAPEARARTG